LTARRLVVLALALAATAFTLLPICNALFDCGCTWPMWGAATHCNIHHPGPPDCPLCASWLLGGLAAATLFVAWAGLLGVAMKGIKGVRSGV
jgi:hypothetical protein